MSVTVNSLGEYSASVELLKTLGGKSAEEIVSVINKYNLTPAQFREFTASMTGSGLEPWYSELGVPSAGYRVYTNVPVNPAGGSAAAELNSNIGTTTQVAVKTPIETALDQAGNVHASSGLTSVATGLKSGINFIAKEVLPAVTAAGIGIRLGIKIDEALYNLMPDVWDSAGLSSLNPETWGSITADYPDGFLKSAFNTLFAIDNDGVTQQYVDERALGYLASYMASLGMFTAPTTTVDVDNTVPRHPTNIPNPFALSPVNIQYNVGATQLNLEMTSGSGYCAVFRSAINPTEFEFYYASESPFTITRYENNVVRDTLQPSATTLLDKSFYAMSFGGFNVRNITTSFNTLISDDSPNGSVAALCYLMLYGNKHTSGGTEGVTPQEGATLPDFSGCSTIDDYINAIKNQYPDIYNDAVSQNWVNPDSGEEGQTIYVPIGMPTGFLSDEDGDPIGNQPITDGETTGETQTDPAFDPAEYDMTDPDSPSLDEILQRLIDMITDKLPSGYEDPDADPDTDTDTGDPNLPDNPNPTGDGDTPAIVPPTGSASALWSIYNPSQGQVDAFGAWLWSNSFIDQLLKLFNNPMQSIIGIHKIFATPQISGSGSIAVGYLDSGVSANIVSNQYSDVDCGSVTLPEQFGNVFDYTDTLIRLYLPFIGIVSLDTSDVMRSTISVIYHVDVISGACLAEVRVTRDASGGTLYQYAGDAAVRYPLSSGSYMGIVAGVASAVGGIASAVMSGGATLPLAAGAIASGIGSAKTDVQHSGSFSGNAGAMGCKKPYLIIERPQTMIAGGYNRYVGTGDNRIVSVGEMDGYFRIKNARVAGVLNASEEELTEIRSMLESGVIK